MFNGPGAPFDESEAAVLGPTLFPRSSWIGGEEHIAAMLEKSSTVITTTRPRPSGPPPPWSSPIPFVARRRPPAASIRPMPPTRDWPALSLGPGCCPPTSGRPSSRGVPMGEVRSPKDSMNWSNRARSSGLRLSVQERVRSVPVSSFSRGGLRPIALSTNSSSSHCPIPCHRSLESAPPRKFEVD